MTPILPPATFKSYHSTGDQSTNVEGSESDSYEDVLSGEEEDTVVKTSWTTGATSTTTAAAPEVKLYTSTSTSRVDPSNVLL